VTPPHNREILARLDREQDRIRDENEYIRQDPKAEALARRTHRDLLPTLPGAAVLAVLPANADPLAPQDPARRAEFAERLREVITQAMLPQTGFPAAEPAPEVHDGFIEAVCTGCRGSCCRSGGDHAYLNEETIARYIATHPGATPPQILQAYLERLPAETILDSCVFHSATGCGLPRELRSETCNRHLCGKLIHLRASRPAQQPVLGVYFDDGKWVRTALLDERGCRGLSESGEE
jgi:hypothetical protein